MAKNINVAYDWLNMFTKVSERLYLAFFVKMGKTRAQQNRANELRRMEKSKRRQAYFVAEYIQVKYFQLYGEAANFYNALNTLYSNKYDLRKTAEYRSWKMAFNGQKLKSIRKPSLYENIENIAQQQPETEPQSPETEPQGPETEPQSPETEPQSPETEPQSPQTEPQSPETQPQSPETEPQSPQTEPQSPETELVVYSDRMELKIPLLDYQPQTPRNSTPRVTTQTVEIITEETLSQLTIENNILNELTTERIDEIINELRQDFELQHIFAELQQEIELDDEGIDIDIPNDIRLENELLTW